MDNEGTVWNDSYVAMWFENVSLCKRQFRYCGYDAVQLVLLGADGTVIKESAQCPVKLEKPIHLRLNDGKAVELDSGKRKEIELTYDTTVFVEAQQVVYSVEDTSIAVVDENGVVTGVSKGTTKLITTLLPSGQTAEIEINVDGGETPVGPKENPFTDVLEGKFYYDAVLWASYHDPQITAGTSETTFSPNGAATRGQVVTFLWRAAGNPEPTGGKNPFTDVKDGAYYSKAVLWAVEQGITKGTSDTTFSPNKTSTRGEFVTFLYRFAGSPDVGQVHNPFTDVKGSVYYYKPVLWAVEQKVTAGTSATTFSPNKLCTRGEIVTFLWRYMGKE